MAKTTKQPAYYVVAQGQAKSGLSYELRKSNKLKEWDLVIFEVVQFEEEEISKEFRNIPSEETKSIPKLDKDGKKVKDKDGNQVMVNKVYKTSSRTEVEVSTMVMKSKQKQVKKLTFYFRPMASQLRATLQALTNQED